MQILLMLVVGLVSGTLSGLFGIGGGVVIVPFLVLAFRFSQATASGTSLVALLLPVGILGVLEYFKAGKIDWMNIRYGLIIAVGMFVGAYIGSRLAIGMSDTTLRRAFSVFMICVAAKMWFS